jgi:membrane protein DedA with SNARE-associated domain
VSEWLTSILVSWGYVGVFLLVAAARAIPPLPTESAVPLAGAAAAQGDLNLGLVALAAGLGSATGELAWYFPSRILGRDRLLHFLKRRGRWLTLTPKDVDRADAWFARYRGWAVVICQALPGLRSLIAIPAGALGVSPPMFVLYAATGSGVLMLGLASAGYLVAFGWPDLAGYLIYVAGGVFLIALTFYLIRLIRQERRHVAGS